MNLRTVRRMFAAALAVALVPFAAETEVVPIPASVELAAQEATVTGVVTEQATNRPLAGVQVYVPDTGVGALTNAQGRFLLVNVPSGQITLRAELIGYSSGQEVLDLTAGETHTVNFQLREEALALDELVVTGTVGQQRRRELGNTLSSIGPQQLEVQEIGSAQDALAGNVAGLELTSTGGEPGSGGQIRVRGLNSLTQGNSPLIYVDGVRIYNDNLPNNYSQTGRNPLNGINPQDIERIEVVKGAAATTLYGTEASGGVIQIFTKSGSGQDGTSWDAQVRLGLVSQGPIGPDHPDSWFERWGPDSGSLFMEPWLKTGTIQDYNLSVRGTAGEGVVDYFISGGWKESTGTLDRQTNDQLALRGNVGFIPRDNWRIQFNASVNQDYTFFLPLGNLANSFSLNVFRGPFDYTQDQDSVFFTEFDTEARINHFTSGLSVQYGGDNLTARLQLGLDYLDEDYHNTRHFGSLLEPPGYRFARRWRPETRTVDLTTSYNHDLGSVSSTSSVGFQGYQNRLLAVSGISQNFAGPGNPTLETGSVQRTFEDRLEEINAGFFFQQQFGFDDKLFLTAGLRMDGNSAFGDDFGLQPYPKVSLAYVVSDEDFWPNWMQQTRLRAAYGESGRAPGYFDAERTWSPITAGSGQAGVTPSTQGNPDLGPERTREIEGGFEMTTLQGRLSLDFTAYQQVTNDALLNVPQDPSTGYLSSQIQNVGEFQNTGVEFTVNGTVLQRRNLSWDLGSTISLQRSEILNLGATPNIFLGGSLTPGMFAREGYSLPAYFGPIVQNPDEIAAPVLEEEHVGPMHPTRIIGLNSTLNVGGALTLSGRIDYQGGHYTLSHTAWRNAQRTVWPLCHDLAMRIDAGQRDQLTAEERWRCDAWNASWAAYIQPADFMRLRNLTATYRIPEDVVPGFGQNWRVSLSAQNLLLWKKSDNVVEPEGNEGGHTPGSQGELTRHEYYQMPIPRTFTLTVRTSF